MITEEYFLAKVKELAHMRSILIPKDAPAYVYKKFQEFDESDIDKAIIELLTDERKFNFQILRQTMDRIAALRREKEWGEKKAEEKTEAVNFFNENRYTGECNRQECRGCGHVNNCRVRGREWIKNINLIMERGLGKKGADEVIHYMEHDFMGGIGKKKWPGSNS